MTPVFDFIENAIVGLLRIGFLIFFVVQMFMMFFGVRVSSGVARAAAKVLRRRPKRQHRLVHTPVPTKTARVLDRLPTGELVVERKDGTATYVEGNPKLRVATGDEVVIDDQKILGFAPMDAGERMGLHPLKPGTRCGRACAVQAAPKRRKKAG